MPPRRPWRVLRGFTGATTVVSRRHCLAFSGRQIQAKCFIKIRRRRCYSLASFEPEEPDQGTGSDFRNSSPRLASIHDTQRHASPYRHCARRVHDRRRSDRSSKFLGVVGRLAGCSRIAAPRRRVRQVFLARPCSPCKSGCRICRRHRRAPARSRSAPLWRNWYTRST